MTPQLIVALVVTWVLVAAVVAVLVGRTIHAADQHDAQEHRNARRPSRKPPIDRS